MAKRPRLPTSSQDNDGSSQVPPDYKVGRGRPPIHTRFKPGQCGNPRGRPKGSRNVRTIVENALYQPITIREGSRPRRLTKLEAMVLTMINKALQGDVKTQTAVMQLMQSVGMIEVRLEPSGTQPVTAQDQNIIADFLRRLGFSTEEAPTEKKLGDKPSMSARKNKKETKP